MAKRASVHIEVEGLENVLDTIGNLLPKEARNIARSTVHAIAGDIRNGIRRDAPKDTGALRKSIVSVRRRGTPTTVQSDVIAKEAGFYVWFQEHGTIKQSAKPFVNPLVESTRPKIPSLYKELFGKKLEMAMARKAKKAAK
jgi:HK97 gp10 family phage protein